MTPLPFFLIALLPFENAPHGTARCNAAVALTHAAALADVCQSIRHCLWEAGAVPSLSRLAPRTQNPVIAATALDTLRAIFDDALSRALFCCDTGWEGAVREVLPRHHTCANKSK